jgi:hypothetical protein
MPQQPVRARVLRIALLLIAIFNVLALMVFLRGTPVFFALFMFVGETLFGVALILLLGAVIVELRAKEVL